MSFFRLIFFNFFLFLIVIKLQAYDSNLENCDINLRFDVTILGYACFADGIGRFTYGFIDNFKDKLKINFINRENLLSKVDPDYKNVKKIFNNIAYNKYDSKSNVLINFDLLNFALPMPEATIKIAYSVYESTKIPSDWTELLNRYFDVVIVPSKFLIKSYKKSGVNIPIFLAPHGLYLDDFLNSETVNKKKSPFVFGTSASFIKRKNHELLLNAFLDRFKNNSDVILKLHGRFGDLNIINNLQNIIKHQNVHNVKIITKMFSHKQYLKFMKSLDCYVLVSKGEGFSVTPRESIALGIPTIISDNTAHKTLCKTSYFIPVKSDIKEKDSYGYNFNLSKEDLSNLLVQVYNNYEYYLEKAKGGKDWVRQYSYKNLEKYYINLVRPNKVILGPKNKITYKYLMTNSRSLYKKYLFNQTLY